MAKSVNSVILLGNVGRDPESRYTPSGTQVTSLSLATTESYKDKSGSWQDRTEWHNLVAFDKSAEIIGKYVKKGSRLYVRGSIRTNSWEDKQSGEKKYRTEIVVNDIILLDNKQEESDPF